MRRSPVAFTGLGARAGLMALSLLTACGQAEAPPVGASTSSPSYAGSWRLTEGRGPGGDVPLVNGYRITLDLGGNEISGTAACNSYGGTVEIEEDSFALPDGLFVTEMGCERRVMESEAAYLDALPEADKIARAGDTLTLTGPETELRFEFVPPPPTAELTDTVWHLEALIEGAGPDGIASSVVPALLVLAGKGTVSGSTGCRDFEGEWTERGDEIVFTRLAAEGHYCAEDVRDQDNHVLGALGDGFVARIEEQRLTVIGKGDLGLVYRAGR